MYAGNYLAQRLRSDPPNRDDTVFLDIEATDNRVTFAEFFAAAEKVAAALVRAGVQPGDRVAVQAPKTAAMLELYVGSVLAGAVFLPLNPAYTNTEVSYFLADAEPALFVCDAARIAGLADVAKSAGVPKLWTIGSDESGTLAQHRDQEQGGFIAVARGPDDLAAILYTSGTTGRSKGAMLTHRNLAANAETLVQSWAFTSHDVLIHALPVFHTHGLFVATNVALLAGSAMIFMAKFDATTVCNRMPDATVLMGVPTFYVRLLSEDRLAEASKGMRLFISGSAPLLAETHVRWRATTGHDILERYGMTETGMNTSNPYDGKRSAGTVGFALPDVDIRICDPATGTTLAKGEIGVLEVRGPNVFSGYWRMPEKTAREMRGDGFFVTGDLAKVDADGYVHIVGRDKDLIISGGFNIYPKEIELVLDDVSGIAESAVIGVPHPDLGEAVVAVVVAEPGAQVSEPETLAVVANSIARFKLPKRVIVVPELPRNAMGKVQKQLLRQMHRELF